MYPDKKWYASKTVWGGAIAVIAGIAGAFGIAVGVEDQAVIAESITAIAGAVGGLIAVYGRIKADRRIK